MYRISDYVRHGWVYLNNAARPRHKQLSQLMIYATTRCQSRCKHCAIWKKAEAHLTLDDIKAIMNSQCITRNTCVGLEGGEFLLHPEAESIMEWFMKHHPNYTLLSNCLAAKKLIDAVKTYHPSHLYVSLDGNKETYRQMRGCDGYTKVIEVVEALRNEVKISLMFCLSPWNTFQDMDFVIGIAKQYGIDIRIGIYGTMDFFDTTAELLETDMKNYVAQIPQSIHHTQENYDFVALYNEWRQGHLHLRCHSIFSELVIHADGNVPLCQNLGVMLGNIHEQSLDEIFNAQHTCTMQSRYSRECNGCWINFHRKYDIILLRHLESALPKRLIEAFYGKYQWTANQQETYKQYIKRIKHD